VEAGKQLAEKLIVYKDKNDVIVYGLPRGGVPIAAAVAGILNIPLDIVSVRKIRAPDQPELALGAVSADGQSIIDHELVSVLGLTQEDIKVLQEAGRQEAQRRLNLYRSAIIAVTIQGKTAIIVDDGVATGATMQVAIRTLRAQGAQNVIVAIPVLPYENLELLSKAADKLVYLEAPRTFYGVSQFYVSFPQLTDEDVLAILKDMKKGVH
jgi:putative phosphoribosyl transferase